MSLQMGVSDTPRKDSDRFPRRRLIPPAGRHDAGLALSVSARVIHKHCGFGALRAASCHDARVVTLGGARWRA